MTATWLVLGADAPAGALAAAAAYDVSGRAFGVLAAVRAGGDDAEPAGALGRIDPALVDAAGAACVASLVVLPASRRLPFDDEAVLQARRDALADWGLDGCSTLAGDSVHLRGALSVARGPRVDALLRDPFARLAPAVRLHVAAGLLGSTPHPVGPVVERYAGRPWPAAGFGDADPAARRVPHSDMMSSRA